MANILQHYEGALVGALVGDCLGAPFEFKLGDDYEKNMDKILRFFSSVDKGRKKGKCDYTDDTAMTRCVAKSLVENDRLDARDLSKKCTEEYFREPKRGYGGSISYVFKQLREEQYANPYGPAARQFNGKGSFGNGGAMRIAPAALFGLHFDEKDFNELVTNITRVTHSNKDAINGAILECSAVQLALKAKLSEAPLTVDHLLTELLRRVQQLEGSERPYRAKLLKIGQLLPETRPEDVRDIASELGNEVSAIESVPSALFAFLHNVDRAPEDWEEDFNSFQRTIMYAISLGGDTDTIASMAGAIAGAYHGIKSIPEEWQEACEKLDEAKELARQLYESAKDSSKSAAAANCLIS